MQPSTPTHLILYTHIMGTDLCFILMNSSSFKEFLKFIQVKFYSALLQATVNPQDQLF